MVGAPFRVRKANHLQMNIGKIREHKHRLPRQLYVGNISCVFTICVLNGKELFVSQDIFTSIKGILLDSLIRAKCGAYVYLFMPDHVHLLLQGIEDESDLWKCIVDFKQRSGFWLSRNEYSEEWQKGFYDHILRKEEDVEKHARYILNNPVRKRTAEEWKEYPFKGSSIYDFEKW